MKQHKLITNLHYKVLKALVKPVDAQKLLGWARSAI